MKEWIFPQDATSSEELKAWIEKRTVPGVTREKWSKLDIGKDVTLKIKAQNFNPSDVKSAAAVFDEARSLIDAASQAICATNHTIHAETWSQKITDLALHYFPS